MSRYTRRKIFIFTACALLCLVMAINAYAISVSIDRPIIRVVAPAGGTATETLIVRNKGIGALAVKIEIEDWAYDETRNVVLRPPGSTKYSCAEWLDVSPRDIFIPAEEEREVYITIRVPEDAVGGHYAALSVESITATSRQQGIGANIATKLVSLFLHETKGKSNKVGTFASFDVIKPTANKPLVVKYEIKNEGNTQLSTISTVTISDEKGNVFGRAASKRRRGGFPGEIIRDKVEWFGSLPQGTYDVILTVNLGDDMLPMVEQKTIVVEKDIQ